MGTDTSGLGCWPYSKLVGCNGHQFLIITTYQVGAHQPIIGSNTIYTQQYHILLNQGNLDPNLRETFMQDIIAFICRWQPTHNILLCMDANDTTLWSNDHGLDNILEATNLIDLHQYQFPSCPSLATHHCSSKTIDYYCLGYHGFVEALTGAWMLPFSLPPTLTSDHRTLGLKFDHNILFGQKIPHNKLTIKCGIYSNAYPTICKFNDDVATECNWQGLFNAAQTLSL